MEIEIIIFGWIILGLINLLILNWAIKKDPTMLYYGGGFLYEIGLLVIWFSFAFIIIPFFIARTINKYTHYKIKQVINSLRKK